MTGHETNISKFKKTEIIPTIFSDHNGMKLEINKSKMRWFTNIQKLNNTLLKNHWFKEEIKREVKNYLDTNENENTSCQILWNVAETVLRGKFIAIMHILRN